MAIRNETDMTKPVDDILSLRNYLSRMWEGLVSYRRYPIFDDIPRARQIAMMSRMIQCEKGISDMIDAIDIYMDQLAKEKQKELERESEADWIWQKTFGGL